MIKEREEVKTVIKKREEVKTVIKKERRGKNGEREREEVKWR